MLGVSAWKWGWGARMDWSVLIGAALIVYAAAVLVRHIRAARRGEAKCPYCDGACGDCPRKK